jgi:hypothetical protein
MSRSLSQSYSLATVAGIILPTVHPLTTRSQRENWQSAGCWAPTLSGGSIDYGCKGANETANRNSSVDFHFAFGVPGGGASATSNSEAAAADLKRRYREGPGYVSFLEGGFSKPFSQKTATTT